MGYRICRRIQIRMAKSLTRASTYFLMIPSDVGFIGETAELILSWLGSVCGSLDENTAFELKVIINELLSNAIIHGNKEQAGKNVKISVGAHQGTCVFLIVEDEGEGYNYTEFLTEMRRCLSEDADLDCFKETGRGILIAANLCDKMKFNRKGNKVVILKNLAR